MKTTIPAAPTVTSYAEKVFIVELGARLDLEVLFLPCVTQARLLFAGRELRHVEVGLA